MKNSKSKGSKKGLGVVVAGAAAVAAAGAYFLYGTKEGAKQRKKIKGFALRAKGEVLEELENMKDVTEDKYDEVVSRVMKKYEKLDKKYGGEIEKVRKDLLGLWKQLKKQIK